MPVTHTIPVRFGDCDVAKVVYYPRILHYCHVTMEELFGHATGVPYDRIVLEEGVGYPTVKLAVEYTAPVRLGDTLTATAVEQTLRGRSGITDVTVTNQSGETIALFRGASRALGSPLFEE